MRRAWAALVLVACGQPPPPRDTISSQRPAPPDAAIVPDATIAEVGPPIALPGCTPADTEARTKEISAIADRLEASTADARTILDELRVLLDKPCMRHVRPAIVFPAEPTVERTRAAFGWGVDFYLKEAASGIGQRFGHPVQIIPPSLMPDLSAVDKTAAAAARCTATDGSCARTASYILRAEDAFDVRYETALSWYEFRQPGGGATHVEMPVSTCSQWPLEHHDMKVPTTYEAWVSCVTSRVPTTQRFAERNLSAPSSGWLVLRGERGHYDIDDEIRAYDLATGAAYVASDIHVMAPKPGQKTGIDAYAGHVDPGQLREIVFMLLARRALVKVRTRQVYAAIPDKLSRELTPDGSFPAPSEWPTSYVTSSSETMIDFVYRDGKTRHAGDFRWPESFFWADTHIVNLVEVMEAGLVRGCAPAKLPDAKSLEIPATTSAPLVKAFEGLRSSSICKTK